MSPNSSHDSTHLGNHLPFELHCLLESNNSIVFSIYTATTTLLLPMFLFILHHGVQQWRRNRSPSSSSTASVSHSDVFTYHMVTMELVGVSGSLLCCGAAYRKDAVQLLVGGMMLCFTWFGQLSFHVLTCVDRYVAAVHPVTYLRLRNGTGVWIRNGAVTGVWLLGVVGMSLGEFREVTYFVLFLLAFSLTTTCFCSISVLCVLIGPGPGEHGGSRWRVDQSKKRAFFIILDILVVLLLKFTGNTVWFVMHVMKGFQCNVAMAWINWINLPSSLVLPYLFLQRTGKVSCCKNVLLTG